VDPREITVEIAFEVFVNRLNTIGFNVSRIQKLADIGGVFPNLRAQIVPNPVTGEAYLLLDVPKDPPPPMALGFKPKQLYVPSVPSVRATVQDRMPELLERAEATLQTLKGIAARVPRSLDRSDRFFTNVERIVHESELPALSAESRKFFTATSAHVEQMRSDMNGMVGPGGALVKFTEEARAASQAARESAETSRLAADDLRRSLPVIRDSLEQMRELSRVLEEQPESVVHGKRPKGKH
jgi:hypothetical protein